MIHKVYSFNSELHLVTGVQKVLMDIHHAIKKDFDAKIVGFKDFQNLNPVLGIERNDYVRLRTPFMFHNSIVIVHERKFLLLFWLLNNILRQRIKIVYIHHNLFYDNVKLTILPEYIVSISDKVTENLLTVFHAKEKSIRKIYNCTKDIHPQPHKLMNAKGEIKIIYPARINDTKRQFEIYHQLKNKIDSRIKILFAGDGPKYEELKKITEGDNQFVALGFQSNVCQLLQDCDFMMLFSKHEGLPISLIEANMCGTPVVCNDVGGNAELVHNDVNGFVVNEWDELVEVLNNLPNMTEEEYKQLSTNGRRIFEDNFTFDKFQKNYCDLLEYIIQQDA